MNCDAKTLVWPAWIGSDGHPGIAQCERPSGHPDEHRGKLTRDVITYSGEVSRTELTWYEDDRRTFRGELTMCYWRDGDLHVANRRCVLPEGHRGAHAT